MTPSIGGCGKVIVTAHALFVPVGEMQHRTRMRLRRHNVRTFRHIKIENRAPTLFEDVDEIRQPHARTAERGRNNNCDPFCTK